MNRLLGFGTYDVRSHPRVRVILDGLRGSGYRVQELNRPLGIDTAGRVGALNNPTKLVGFGITLIMRWASLASGARRFRGANAPDYLMVGYMGHFDVLLARRLFPKTPIILDHLIFASDTAKDRGANGGVLQRTLRSLDRRALKAASIVVLDTPAHRELIPEDLRGKATVVVPVGAPDPWFDARANARSSDDRILSVVFFGLYTPLQGAPAIAEGIRRAAERVPLRVTMIGTGQDYEECRSTLDGVDVEWIDWVDPEDLPGVVASHEVCIGILGTTPKAQRVVPNKVYQGMAAGCCVVTSRTPPQVDILGDAVEYCEPGSSSDLAAALIRLSNDRGRLEHQRRRGAALADAAFRSSAVVRPLIEAMR